MDSHELKDLLDAVKDGRLTPAVAAERIQIHPYQDAGEFAKVDLHRRLRCGFPEVIFGQGKTAEQIEAISETLLATRAGRAGHARRSSGGGASRSRSSPRASTTPWAGRSGSVGPATPGRSSAGS